MSAGRRAGSSPRGFTLVELVVCIVLVAIVAFFIVLFLNAPVQEYFQQTGRADLIDSADRIANAETADVRTALPNSLRAARSGSLWSVEFLQTAGTARYYGAGENQSSTEDLNMSPQSVRSFGTVEAFSAAGAPYSARYLSVANLGRPGHDAYANASATLTPARTVVRINPRPPLPLVSGENQVTLSSPMSFAPDGLPTPAHNAYLVTGPVSYVCDTAAGTLVRYSGYSLTAAQAVPPVGGTRALIAHDVSSCTMSVFRDPSNPGYRFGEVAILNVTLSSGGESFQLFLEAPTEYNR